MTSCCMTSADSKLSVTVNYADWMGELPDKLHDISLTQLAIPGSHDSAAFTLDQEGPLAPDCDKSVVELSKVFGNLLKGIIYKWSVTQSFNIVQQLEAGVRYFDMRIATKPGCDDLYIIHGLYGMKLADFLVHLLSYLKNHPKEVVILDLNHLYNMKESNHQQCQGMITDILGPKLCPLVDTESVNLSMMWENNLQVLVFYHCETALENFQLWPGCLMPSPWADTCDVKSLLSFLEGNYKKGRSCESFYVTQCVLTLDAGFIIAHFTGTLKNTLDAKVAPPFVDWLKTKKAGKGGINVCIMDFVEMADYIHHVIMLNHSLAQSL